MKMIRILMLLAMAVIAVSGQSQSLRSYRPGMVFPEDYVPRDTLVVVAYNTENFTDRKDNPYIVNRTEDSASRNNTDREELFVRAIRAAGADVLMIEEFETVAYLKELNQRYDLGYRYFASSESQTWYQNTMLMSKVPVGTFRTYGASYSPVVGELDRDGHAALQTNINSRIWIAEIWPKEGQRIYFCGVHLKAGRNRSDTATRTGQIQLLKGEFGRIVREDKKACIVMAGDFNATPESAEFKLLQQGDKRTQLVDPLAGQAVFSHPAGNPRWRIDHILYNRNLAARIVPGSTGPVQLLSKPEMEQLSDHLPVMTRIVVK